MYYYTQNQICREKEEILEGFSKSQFATLSKKQTEIKQYLISDTLRKRNRIEYYDRMSEVRRNGDYEQYLEVLRKDTF